MSSIFSMAWNDVAAKFDFAGFTTIEQQAIEAAFKVGYDGSAKARGMLDKLVRLNRDLRIEKVPNAFQAFVGFQAIVNAYWIQVDPSVLDDLRFINRNGKAVAISLTTALLHEAVHAIEGIRDTPRDTNTNSEGPTVVFTNQIRAELGIEDERVSYEGAAFIPTLTDGQEYSEGELIENALITSARRDTSRNSPGTKDVLIGTDADNQLLAGANRDFLWAQGGNDTVTGGGGNDFLDGGSGTDVGIYSGRFDQYSISETSLGTWSIQDNRGGSPDGTDTITNIEKLSFSDGISDLVSGSPAAAPGQNVVLLIDTSGSMGDDIAAVRAAATQIVESLFGTDTDPINSRLAIVEFHDSVPPTTHLTFTNQENIADRKAAALEAVGRLDIIGGGAEPMYGAMLHALEGGAGVWEAGATSNRLIIFSDEPPADPEKRTAALAAAASLSTQVTQPLGPQPLVPSYVASQPRSPALDGALISESILAPEDADLGNVPLVPSNNLVGVAALPVVIGNDPAALAAAEQLAADTGGKVFTAANAADAANAVLEAINTPPVINPPAAPPRSTNDNGPTEAGPTSNPLLANIRSALTGIQGGAINSIEGSDSAETHNGSEQNDFIRALGDNDQIYGLAGFDFTNGNAGDDFISSGDDNDVARGGADNDFVNGNRGDDLVFGDSGDDILRGGRGNDIMNGNAGNDRMFGDAGSDLFILSQGTDVIEDFSFSDGDQIAILSGQTYTISQVGLDLVITRAQGTTTLIAIDINQFNSINPIQII